MAIAPSRLGRFVHEEGFTWPRNESEARAEHTAADEIVVRRLRESGLIRADVSDAQVIETFDASRREHAAGDYDLFNSPEERVRVFLEPYLTKKGLRWAEPLRSLGF